MIVNKILITWNFRRLSLGLFGLGGLRPPELLCDDAGGVQKVVTDGVTSSSIQSSSAIVVSKKSGLKLIEIPMKKMNEKWMVFRHDRFEKCCFFFVVTKIQNSSN